MVGCCTCARPVVSDGLVNSEELDEDYGDEGGYEDLSPEDYGE